jgi:Domain of unknown function (DUF1905)
MKADLWIYPGETANWHFLTLPKKESDAIRKRFGASKRGWGSLRVSVCIGTTTWNTSIFPDKKRDAYLLPIKADVRTRENVSAGDRVAFRIDIQE